MAKTNSSSGKNPKPSSPKPIQAPTGNVGTRGGDKGKIIKK